MESHKSAFLTFDDGPSPFTPAILDILKQYQAPATFFMCGKNIERYPETAKRVKQEGHAVGNHAYSHIFWKTVTGYGMAQEINKTDKIIKNTIGETPTLFRAPWGIVNPRSKLTAQQLHYEIYQWNISALDWLQPVITYGYMRKRILSHTRPGAILLFHDGHGTYKHMTRKKTVALVAELIPYLQKEGYTFRLLPEKENLIPDL